MLDMGSFCFIARIMVSRAALTRFDSVQHKIVLRHPTFVVFSSWMYTDEEYRIKYR